MAGQNHDSTLLCYVIVNCWVNTSPNVFKRFKGIPFQQQKNCMSFQWLPALLSHLQTKRGSIVLPFGFVKAIFLYGGTEGQIKMSCPPQTIEEHCSTLWFHSPSEDPFFLLRKQAKPWGSEVFLSLCSFEENQSIIQILNRKNELWSLYTIQKTYSFEGGLGIGAEETDYDYSHLNISVLINYNCDLNKIMF